MKEYLNTKNSDERSVLETGVPIDSTDNQLALWILYSRQVNPAVQTMIKGDADLEFPVVREILSILQDKNVNRYSLVTNLRAVEVKEDEIAE
ncbi:MAG TPA: hypothetical protein PKO42_08570 [Tenuifilaceae bacterium]|nr:hypothetical protein [Tenuifilaceae bacterium]